MGTIFINLKLLVTQNSSQSSPLCSTRQKSRWMRMLGFAQSSPSFHYFWCHAQSKTRLALPRNSFAVRRVFGGITILACSQLTTSSHSCSSGCRRGGLRLAASRPHQPQGRLRAHVAARTPPRVFCGLCGNPHRRVPSRDMSWLLRRRTSEPVYWVHPCLHIKLWNPEK